MGIAFFLFGLLPRVVIAAWIVVAYSFVVVYLGGILQFPEWLSRLSPFGHVPQLPAADLELLPLVALTVVGAALIGAGLAGFRRRNLQSPA